jgi:hypothetical protein
MACDIDRNHVDSRLLKVFVGYTVHLFETIQDICSNVIHSDKSHLHGFRARAVSYEEEDKRSF